MAGEYYPKGEPVWPIAAFGLFNEAPEQAQELMVRSVAEDPATIVSIWDAGVCLRGVSQAAVVLNDTPIRNLLGRHMTELMTPQQAAERVPLIHYTINSGRSLLLHELLVGMRFMTRMLPLSGRRCMVLARPASMGQNLRGDPTSLVELESGSWGWLDGMSRREIEAVVYLARGLSNGQIAQRMGCCRDAVGGLIGSAMRKQGLRRRHELFRRGFDSGIGDFEDHHWKVLLDKHFQDREVESFA